MRRKQVAIVEHAVGGCHQSLIQGIAHFASQRQDWSLRWYRLENAGDIQNLVADAVLVISTDPAWAATTLTDARPTVVAGSFPQISNAAAAYCEPRMIGAYAADHLIQSGHRHLACFSYRHGIAEEMRDGFIEHARRQEIEPRLYSASSELAASQDGEHSPIAEWLQSLPRPTGIFSTCDRYGANLCEVARDLHLLVPDMLAMVVADSASGYCEVSRPPLSTVAQPSEEIGFQAAAILADLMEGAAPRSVSLTPNHVIRRGSTGTPATDDLHVRQAVEFIHHNAHHPIGVRDVLKNVRSSRRALEQRFRRALNRTIMEEIRRTRFELALGLLSNGELPISQIAQQCGLGSSAHLNQLTRRYTGLSPREVRRRGKPQA